MQLGLLQYLVPPLNPPLTPPLNRHHLSPLGLECCRYDNSHQPRFFDLKYASEIWMGGPMFEMGWRQKVKQVEVVDENTTLQMALAVLLSKLREKWELALSTGDEQIAEMLETSQPPAIQTFKEIFKPSAEWCEEWL